MHGGVDLTPSVQTGLAWFYALVGLINLAFAWSQRKNSSRPTLIWNILGAVAIVLAALYAFHVGPVFPHSLRDLIDFGIERGLLALGITGAANSAAGYLFAALLALSILATLADLVLSYCMGDSRREMAKRTFGGILRCPDPGTRQVGWWLILSLLAILYSGTNAISFFLASVAGFAAMIVWRKPFTSVHVAWGLLNLGLFFGGLSMTDYDFRQIVIKPDNIPIVGMVFVVGYFTWLAFRKAVINDERMAQGLPPAEKEEDEKVLVWPDLVYTELICMVVVTVILIVWAVVLPAPLEQPASSTKTPFSSKAPWYFLGLQEMLVYYDPWIAGVLLPTMIILGLMAMPYIDFNQKGNGYYSYEQRPFAIINFLFGFLVLWVTLIFLGTFLRGPNWNFFGPYETWDTHKIVAANNVNVSDYFWVRGLGVIWEQPVSGISWGAIFMRELPGIAIILLYFLAIPPLLARTVLRGFYLRMGFIRFMVLVTLIQFMASLPIKMILRWAFNLKYIVAIPEIFFNI